MSARRSCRELVVCQSRTPACAECPEQNRPMQHPARAGRVVPLVLRRVFWGVVFLALSWLAWGLYRLPPKQFGALAARALRWADAAEMELLVLNVEARLCRERRAARRG